MYELTQTQMRALNPKRMLYWRSWGLSALDLAKEYAIPYRLTSERWKQYKIEHKHKIKVNL
jgi:hypothetical protein